jgi:hypothetical protein
VPILIGRSQLDSCDSSVATHLDDPERSNPSPL